MGSNIDIRKNPRIFRLFWLSVILIGFSFCAPLIFTQTSFLGVDFTNTGQIGDTIGGVMSPFVALAGVLVTYMAFYIQFRANEQQREQFRLEITSDKFDNQFYEMLRLHKENVNEIRLSFHDGGTISGRETFKYLHREVRFIYELLMENAYITDSLNNSKSKLYLKLAYGIFFNGTDHYLYFSEEDTDQKTEFIDDLCSVLTTINSSNKLTSLPQSEFSNFKIHSWAESDLQKMRYDLFQGHSSILAHYYRHLFQTVKFVANRQEDDSFTFEDKRNYLRILRSQLSNEEQVMLFYNWVAGFGRNWENSTNKFFTDYRMIHNLYNEMLIDEFKVEDFFDLESIEYRREKNREHDPIFEFEDWE